MPQSSSRKTRRRASGTRRTIAATGYREKRGLAVSLRPVAGPRLAAALGERRQAGPNRLAGLVFLCAHHRWQETRPFRGGETWSEASKKAEPTEARGRLGRSAPRVFQAFGGTRWDTTTITPARGIPRWPSAPSASGSPTPGELPLLALSCEGGEAAAGRKRPPSCKMCRLTDAMAPPSIHY